MASWGIICVTSGMPHQFRTSRTSLVGPLSFAYFCLKLGESFRCFSSNGSRNESVYYFLSLLSTSSSFSYFSSSERGGGGREPDRYFLFFSFPSLLLLLLFCDEFFGKKRSTGALVPYHSVGTFRLRFHFFANLWPRYWSASTSGG